MAATDPTGQNGPLPGETLVEYLARIAQIAIKAQQAHDALPTGKAFDPAGLAYFFMAVVLYLVIVSFTNQQEAIVLSLILIFGALYVNQHARGGKTIFDTLGVTSK